MPIDVERLAKIALTLRVDADGKVFDALTKVSREIAGAELSESRMRSLARQLYWNHDVPIESLYGLLPVSPLKIHEWVCDGEKRLKCVMCKDVVRLKLHMRDDLADSNLGGVVCSYCHYEQVVAQELAKEEELLHARVAKLRAMEYPEYLLTEHWQEMRRRTLTADGHTCRICNSTHDLNVHHRTYKRLGNESSEDLVTLCKSCHTLFHKAGKLASNLEGAQSNAVVASLDGYP